MLGFIYATRESARSDAPPTLIQSSLILAVTCVMGCDVCGTAPEAGRRLQVYTPTGDALCHRCLCERCGLPLRRFGLSIQSSDVIVTCNCSHTLPSSRASSAYASPQRTAVRTKRGGAESGKGERRREKGRSRKKSARKKEKSAPNLNDRQRSASPRWSSSAG